MKRFWIFLLLWACFLIMAGIVGRFDYEEALSQQKFNAQHKKVIDNIFKAR